MSVNPLVISLDKAILKRRNMSKIRGLCPRYIQFWKKCIKISYNFYCFPWIPSGFSFISLCSRLFGAYEFISNLKSSEIVTLIIVQFASLSCLSLLTLNSSLPDINFILLISCFSSYLFWVLFLFCFFASLVAQKVKHLPAIKETWVWSLGQDSGKGNGNLLQYSCLKNPMDREAW